MATHAQAPKQQPPGTIQAPDAASGAPTPAEFEDMVGKAELGFRRWLQESGASTGFTVYPSSRQIRRSLQVLSETIDSVDLSGIAL
ncbi:hypothetical protein IWQ57_000823 [Coemansia nantahalensis]|uniref:Uncharacterized protein n=1 Tax=Coemansia nantahalensis TaxID=2789366 RepID=A0ACC1K6I0_9FUNG|nr:hypothetical protein IWQ57_000823 [Coemansia nantahalensis]